MRPTLRPGDGLLALRGGTPRRGQLRVFPDPTLPVAVARQAGRRRARRRSRRRRSRPAPTTRMRPVSSTPDGSGGCRLSGSYRVVWTVRGQLTTGCGRSEQNDQSQNAEQHQRR